MLGWLVKRNENENENENGNDRLDIRARVGTRPSLLTWTAQDLSAQAMDVAIDRNRVDPRRVLGAAL